MAKKGFEIYCRVLGACHPQTLEAEELLADYYSVVKNYNKAQTIYKNVYEGKKCVLGEDSIGATHVLVKLAKSGIHLGKADKEIEEMLARAVERYSRVFGECHPQTFDAEELLADYYFLAKNYNKAQTIYKSVYERACRNFGNESKRARNIKPKLDKVISVIDDNKSDKSGSETCPRLDALISLVFHQL